MDISQLPGLGPKRLQALHESGIYTLSDLLYYIPRTWLDRTRIDEIANCKPGDNAIVIGTVVQAGIIRGRKSRFQATLRDNSGQIQLLFFRSANYWAKNIKPGMRFIAIGKTGEFRGLQMVHPELQKIEEGEDFQGGIVPVYTITEPMREAKIEQRFFRKLFDSIFKLPNLHLPASCPEELVRFMELAPVLENLKRLHLPRSFGETYQGRRQLKKLELLPFCLRMVHRRRNLQTRGKERRVNEGLVMKIKNELPFTLTAGQEKALAQIMEGLSGKKQFHALLQGDVGSGKTVIALLAILAVSGNGEQSALMVPTDILARQHEASLAPYFKSAGIRTALLVGASPAAERKRILAELQMGLLDVVIGTHALFSKDVIFNNLGFVIIDEQHRFGVNQREALLAKGNYPDLLVMSATPIPRSLAMTFYGDLEPIVMKEKPPGRKPVKTRLIENAKRDAMKKFLADEIRAGNRCYWVANRVNADDESETLSVYDIHEELSAFSSEWKTGVIHGQMNETERDAVLAEFGAGTLQLLIATTVIEVGVNVPEANLIVIDQPENFGLAQLHQLRGRVGRGGKESWCFLMCGAQNPARERLAEFSGTEDGFEIAELDMRNRGAGNLEGSEQSGGWIFRWFDWIEDEPLIQEMLALAEIILDNKPGFDTAAREKIQIWYNETTFPNEDGIH
ncbi:MAG: ATP-dependent DNA helicase RecG [Fibrobacter sp.]|jgi:ATP-dependent DNA helicase RecG|nr:ATP-dependent DNA helicase RecG [Fibrobacter sp.]